MADLKALILEAEDLDRAPVSVPEWGVKDGQLFVRTLTGLERDRWEMEIVDANAQGGARLNTKKSIRASLLARCLVDAEGNRVFGDGDVNALAAKSAKVLGRLFGRASEVNGLGDDDVEELVKNSTGETDDS